MVSTELTSELQRLQLMVNAVRKALREEDSEAARLLIGVAERLLLLSEVAEEEDSALASDDVVQALSRLAAGRAEPD
jgi:hypothetical protein